MSKSKARKLWTISWQLGLCLLLLAWISHQIFLKEGELSFGRQGLNWNDLPRAEKWHNAWTIGPREMVHTLSLIQPWAFVAALAMAWAMIMLGVVRWRMILKAQGLSLPMGRATRISFVAQFFSSFLLGSVGGDMIKAYYAARETHHLKTEAVVTVFVDRMIGLWAMLLFAGIMMIPNVSLLKDLMKRSDRMETLGVILVILGMLAASTIILFLGFWGGVSKRFPRARVLLRRMPKGDMIERSIDACRYFGKKPALLLRCLVLSLIVNVIVVLQFAVLGKGLGLDIPTLALSVIVPSIICISALPITPGGLGLRENLCVFMLGGVGVLGTSALCLSLLAFATILFWSIVGGAVYLGLKDREHLDEVTRENSNGNAEKRVA